MDNNMQFQILSKDTILKKARYMPESNSIYYYNLNMIGIGNLQLQKLKTITNNSVLINLCAEPSVFINDKAYILRDLSNPLINVKHLININEHILKDLEIKLKDEITLQMEQSRSLNVLDDDNLELTKANINVRNLKTPEEFFCNLNTKKYFRVPISSHDCGINNGSIDCLNSIFSNTCKDETIIVYSGMNSTRNTFAYCIQTIQLRQTNCFTTKKNMMRKMNSFYVVHNLMHLIKDKKHQNHLDAIFSALPAEKRYVNIITDILAQSPTDDNKLYYVVTLIRRYCTLVLFSVYLSNHQSEFTFKEFICSKYEFKGFYDYVKAKKPASLVSHSNFNILTASIKNRSFFLTYVYVRLEKNKIEQNIVKLDEQRPAHYLFVNLKEEPVFYIGDVEYAMREKHRAHKMFTAFRMVDKDRISAMENKFVNKIKGQYNCTGNLVVFTYKNNFLQAHNISHINIDSIKTQDAYFETIYYKDYIRLPITPSIAFRFSKIDEYIMLFNDAKKEYSHMILHSDTSMERSGYFSIISNMILNPTCFFDHEEDIYSIDCFLCLVHLIENGMKSYKTTNNLFEKQFNETFKEYCLQVRQHKDILRSIKKFFLIVCLHSYLNSMVSAEVSFEKWMLNRNDIMILYNKIDKYNSNDITESSTFTNTKIKMQDGIVLNEHSILKNDYFIGSNFFHLYKHIEGLQNLRIVKINDLVIVGCSMPTKAGIIGVKKHLKQKYDIHSDEILWICLREEPVIFIDDRPYVLRHYNNVNENIEITGISKNKIESMENQLKDDISKRPEVLIYDEIEKNGIIETISISMKYQSVATANTLFTQSIKYYERIPITDEQSPLPSIIDEIYRVITKKKYFALVLNCQMGKGRTTTGMIISYLILEYKTCAGTTYAIKYKLISLLVKFLANGIKSLAVCDEAINKFSHLENLRDVIDKYDSISQYKKKKNFMLRYFYLICFTEFLLQGSCDSYAEFIGKNSVITSLIDQFDEIKFEII